MITTTMAGRLSRRDPLYHRERLRVSVSFQEAKGHRIVAGSKCILTSKRSTADGKVVLWFDLTVASKDSPWLRVSDDGRIRVPIGKEDAPLFLEGASYFLYLWKW
jgi:hypothetical protein